MTEIVILGGGMVAGFAAQQMAEQGLDDHRLTIVSADSEQPYHRPPLSKGFLAGEEEAEEIVINEPELYEDHGIELRLRTGVAEVDLDRRRLVTEEGDEIPFEKLLIATGTLPRSLDVPGADLDGVFTLRWMADSKKIRNAAAQTGQAVVVGGGFIGTEVAAVLADQEVSTTLAYRGERLLGNLFTPEMSRYFESVFREHGVTLMPGVEATRFHPTPDGGGRVGAVELSGGERLDAGLVVLGVGVEPATGMLEGSGLELDDGVVVDERLATGTDGVWAAGDVARYRDVLFDTRRRVEHWDNAVEQGKLAGRNLLGAGEVYRRVPYFFSDVFDLSWELWGDPDGADEVVMRGDLASGRFSTWWLAGRRVVAAFVMDRPDAEREAAEPLIRTGRPVDAGQLADTGIALEAPSEP